MAQPRRHKKTGVQKIISYGRQTISPADIRAVTQVLNSPWLTQGPMVSRFEEALAQYCGARYAVAVTNGTAALHLAYLALGLQDGDEIITTPNTFVATANMAVALGARPVFVDIRTDTYAINESKIEESITNKTKLVVPVHYAGHPAEMKRITQLAKKHKLKVVEDACHALGATYHGKRIGGLESDMTIFSFHPVKLITTGEGGAIMTNSKAYYDLLLMLRSHGIRRDAEGFNHMHELGFNYRMTDIQAALGLAQLKRLDQFIEKRGQIAQRYETLLEGCEDVVLPREAAGSRSAWHLYPIRLSPTLVPHRKTIMQRLREKNIAVQVHYPPVYLQPYYAKQGYRQGLCREAEDFAEAELSMPIYPLLTRAEQTYVVRSFTEIINELRV